MCLATPMRVLATDGSRGRVDTLGVELEVALDLVEDVQPGDYVIVHAGYAIARVSAAEAQETLAILARLEQSWEATG